MKKIICPTDFSDTAKNAIAYAAKVSQLMGAQLTIFSVQNTFDLTKLEIISRNGLTIEAAKELLENECREISKTFKISCNAVVQTSITSLADTIAEKAAAFDLIVMGTNGADDIFQFFSGSNAYKATQKLNVPALIIPAGCMYSEIKKIVYAFDYLRERKLPLDQLIPIVKGLPAQLIVLQIMEEAPSVQMEEDLNELQIILQHHYEEKVTLQFETIRSSQITTSINHDIAETHPDALAVCTINRNFLESLFHKSVIKNLTNISEYPLMVFHG